MEGSGPAGKLGVVRECAALLRENSAGSSTAQILATLERLKAVRVTPNVLRKTEVGKLINSKALLHHADLDVRQRSSALVASWRAIVKEATRTGAEPSVPGKRGSSFMEPMASMGGGGDGGASSSNAPPAVFDPAEGAASRRRRLSAPSMAGSAGGPSVVGPAALLSLAVGAAVPPLAYELRGERKGSTPSGPTAGAVPRQVASTATNRYAPEGSGAGGGGAQKAGGDVGGSFAMSGSSGSVGRSAQASGGAASSSAQPSFASAAGGSGVAAAALAALADGGSSRSPAPSAPSGAFCTPASSSSRSAAPAASSSGAARSGGGSRGHSSSQGSKPGKRESPKIDLVSALCESVPHPTGSGGGRRIGGYFCYENFKSGNCSRGDSCPFPHYGSDGQ